MVKGCIVTRGEVVDPVLDHLQTDIVSHATLYRRPTRSMM